MPDNAFVFTRFRNEPTNHARVWISPTLRIEKVAASGLGAQLGTLVSAETRAALRAPPADFWALNEPQLGWLMITDHCLYRVYPASGELQVYAGRRAQRVKWNSLWAQIEIHRRAPAAPGSRKKGPPAKMQRHRKLGSAAVRKFSSALLGLDSRDLTDFVCVL